MEAFVENHGTLMLSDSGGLCFLINCYYNEKGAKGAGRASLTGKRPDNSHH